MGFERQLRQPTSPGQPWKSRPLRTGSSFVLVIPTRRAIAARWDKVEYEPGEACQLSLLGAGLGTAPLQLIVETKQDDGCWSAFTRLSADIRDEGREAVAAWRFPPEPVQPGAASVREVDGSFLSDARFEDVRDLEHEGPVWLLARATGLEGRCVRMLLERETISGEWVVVGQAAATVKSGAIRAPVTPEDAT